MKNKMVVIGWTLAVAVILLLPCRAFADSADLSVVSPATVSQGSSFKVDVNVSNIAESNSPQTVSLAGYRCPVMIRSAK